PAALVACLALGPAAAQEASAPPAAAQEPEPPVRLAPVVVTPSRLEQRADQAPASVTVVTQEDIRESASQTVDDLLRQVPGFSLFRRSSSLVAHPTTQGLSLRGIGPSGTSRALVLLDGVPLNDPFGGWVPWSRIPLLGVEQIEVVRGGGSSVWGNYALGGVVHVITRRPTERSAALEASYGSQDTHLVDLLLTETRGPLGIGLEGRHLETGGYPIVARSDRGAIDVDADSRHALFNGRLEVALSPDASVFVSGNYFDEERGNGTPLQFNRTDSGIVAAGGRLRTADDSEWRATLYGHVQEFRSTFSSQAPDRNSETLALDQTVPSTAAGGWLQWSRRFGDHLLSAGAEARWTEGETVEDVFVAGAFARTRVAGGEQWLAGVFVQDVWRPSPAWEVVVGVRGDYWTAFDAFRRDTPPPAGVPARQRFDDAEEVAVSPRIAALFRATPTTTLRASVYQGFRVPTINELYRVFRVRNDVTAANAALEPERLTGGEAGVQQRWGPVEARVTGFWNEVTDLVANVTLDTPLPDCPPGTTCRQRRNLDLARIRGVEAEVEVRVARDWRLLGAWLYSDARVVESRRQRELEGKRLAQVPAHTATVGLRYRNPSILTASVLARYVGDAWEDDLNTLRLGPYVVVDVFLARQLTRWAEVFVAVENLFDREYAVARTSDGVTSIGAPRLVRGGLRLTF
ncbi:MAG TPA: TonB-dependent receptor, partial [Candidatus Tectomicrobia bacterium]|nr:TonB-dependent receptor [Candidatus Tectomicrobia bacterium]